MPKIAIIGCGRMGRHHASKLVGVLGRSIASACDPCESVRARFGAEHPGVEMFADHRELLAETRPDVAWICAPTHLHAPLTIDCADAGVHVMLEKPMALTRAEGETIDAAARRAGITLMLGLCRRFDRGWMTLRELIVDREVIGRPVLWRQLTAGSGPGGWFSEAGQGGGPFVDCGIHNWDFCLWTFGRAVSVKSSLTSLGPGSALDSGVADVVFEYGDRTTLNLSWGLPPGVSGAEAHDVLGPGGVLRFGVPPELRPKGFSPDVHDGFVVERGEARAEVFVYERGDKYADEDAHFLDCIASGTPPATNAADGLAATALAERVFADAAKRGS